MNTWGRKLLIKTMLKAKLIKRGIPELGPIVTVNGFQAVRMLIVHPQSQAPKVLKQFIFAFRNCPGCSVITVLTGEWEVAIILP
jgi:hypothetical protein